MHRTVPLVEEKNKTCLLYLLNPPPPPYLTPLTLLYQFYLIFRTLKLFKSQPSLIWPNPRLAFINITTPSLGNGLRTAGIIIPGTLVK